VNGSSGFGVMTHTPQTKNQNSRIPQANENGCNQQGIFFATSIQFCIIGSKFPSFGCLPLQ
jgi:hypothetical protein